MISGNKPLPKTKMMTNIPIAIWHHQTTVNILRLRQNWHNFAEHIYECIFLDENVWISITISLKFVPKVRINNILALVQIMAWRRPGDKPLSKTMMVALPTHIYITRPQWVNLVLIFIIKCSNNSVCEVLTMQLQQQESINNYVNYVTQPTSQHVNVKPD